MHFPLLDPDLDDFLLRGCCPPPPGPLVGYLKHFLICKKYFNIEKPALAKMVPQQNGFLFICLSFKEDPTSKYTEPWLDSSHVPSIPNVNSYQHPQLFFPTSFTRRKKSRNNELKLQSVWLHTSVHATTVACPDGCW